ncbi:MAG: hypothetical protein HC910_11430 [Spirulinaceae cyanobacterium SM2_1_0]|nr:hypothetical protein [Spirulinaceae cyanobacterium SM2_1_0]
MKHRPPRLGFLIFTTTTLSVIVAGIGLYFIFLANLQTQQAQLNSQLERLVARLEATPESEAEAEADETLPAEDAEPATAAEAEPAEGSRPSPATRRSPLSRRLPS